MTKEGKLQIADYLEEIVQYMKDKADTHPLYNKGIEDTEALIKEFRSSDNKETTWAVSLFFYSYAYVLGLYIN